ncbi:MAG: 3-oxoacyl-ACP reductase [Proteobacteria bacterium]|nr:3-oxoacyl-ACP reductase [Pseudomonadota bacterium]
MRADPSRIALVTGAARGIGLACVRGLLKKNYRVVATDRVPVDASVYGALGGSVRGETLDVTDSAGSESLRVRIDDEWGAVSVLVNNAGISPKKPDGSSSGILEINDAEWEKVVAVNLTSVLRMSQAFLPGMQRMQWGRIVNVSSLAGRAKSLVAGGSYMASKAGVLGLTRAIAAEMGPVGITANAVAPGRILTEMAMQAGEEVNRRYAEQIPVRRLGTADEVAAAILYLASEEAGFVNGALIDINGGFYMP